MSILVTGVAGFIGSHVALALLARGETVVGVDNLNDYYDVTLKQARLARLEGQAGFTFHKLDIADRPAMGDLADRHGDITQVIHLAAQAGVRYSLVNPGAYIHTNINGHFAILELCKNLDRIDHLVYASSSSVYGGNTKLPFSVDDPVDRPLSLYAASKKADELMSHTYSHLYGVPATGLRFFTVYGPWGRPDMAAWLFTKAILAGEPIRVFNNGDMRRDFTYIDDIVAGTIGCLDHPPAVGNGAPHRVYNLGNHRSEALLDYIRLLEDALGRKAEMHLEPMQPGDVKETYADISAAQRDFGFQPATTIAEGVPRFVDWYREYHGLDGGS